MPELPETETIARDLHREVAGTRITGVAITRRDVIRGAAASRWNKRVAGTMVLACWRRAKMVVLVLDSRDRIVVQPRFTGALLLVPPALSTRGAEWHPPPAADPYVAVAFALEDGRALLYRDVRRLGTVALLSPAAWKAAEERLGVEPLDPALDTPRFSELLSASRRPIKARLMDQRVVAGIGNIYATEALWHAGIDPSRPARSISSGEAATLLVSLREILTASIAARGTTFRDYRDAHGERGNYAVQLRAYGRAGAPCVRCGRVLAGTSAIDGRMTVFCAWCQQ